MTRLPAALALLLAGACGTPPCPVSPFHEAANVRASYADMRRPARVIRAEARVDRRDADGRIRGTVLMFIARPDLVRFDAMTQFGPAAVLTSDGERFALTDLRENVFLEGPTCPSNIERLLGFRFAAEEVTRMLLGESPLIEADDETLDCQGGAYRVIRRSATARQVLDYEVRAADLEAPPPEQRMRLRRSEVEEADGSTRWRVTYGDYRVVEDPADDASPRRGVALPFTVRFEDPRQGVDTLVTFQRIDLNVEVPPDAFVQQPRPGLTRRLVSCDR